jgi:hypothetical protein
LSRAPAELAFPPILPSTELQSRLEPGQAVLIFHQSTGGLLGFLVTREAATSWNCGPANRIGGLVSQFLRDLGNYDGSREMTVEELQSDEWQKSGAKLYQALLEGASLSPTAMKELIVVPDGLTWYVPFEALVAKVDDQSTPLATLATVRYAPTVGLAFSFEGTWRRVQRTGLAVGEMIPGDKPEERLAATAELQAVLAGATPLAPPMAASSPAVASVLDALVVLADIDAQGEDPLAWAPLPLDRAEQAGALEQWLLFPGVGPQRVILPGMHTLAERGGKTSRRRGATAEPGDELFFASCSLMASGAETMLLSRWRVGGQSTLDLVREFMQGAPNMPAAAAWQRSVQLAMEMPVDPVAELRVKAPKEGTELTAKHPFFWAGYMVVDSGWRPEAEAPAEPLDPAAAGAAPVVGGVAPPAAAPAAGAPAAAADAAVAPAVEAPMKDEKPGAAPPPRPAPPPARGRRGTEANRPATGGN